MHPAFSVIFLTTLIGAGQGLFLAAFTAESYAAFGLLPAQPVGLPSSFLPMTPAFHAMSPA